MPAGVVEQAGACAEQYRNEVDPDLVHEAGAQQLSAMLALKTSTSFSPAIAVAVATASCGLPTKVYTPPSGTLSGTRWDTMIVGVRAAAPGPLAPHQGMDGS